MRKVSHSPRLTKIVYGGLRPQGGHRDAWWRKHWIEWLESLHMGARLGRGKNYAQLGQIRQVTLEPGALTGEIQGAENTPYHVAFRMAPLPEETIERLLASRPFLAAPLVAHALPIAFEEALQKEGLSLFPRSRKDVSFYCNCKDWARPCKYLAALLCLFADTIAADPQLLLRFRGIPLPEPPQDLTPTLLTTEEINTLRPSTDAGAVPRRLGTLPFWHSSEDFRKTLEDAYRRAQSAALNALEGQRMPPPAPTP